MTDKISQILSRRKIEPFGVAAIFVALSICLPVVSVIIIAASGGWEMFGRLISETAPNYVGTTIALMALVSGLSAIVGTGTAWLVTFYEFPFCRLLRWALLLPLAIPAYIGAYALVDFLEYAGPLQSGLRDIFGWSSSRDYWFFEVRSFPVAVAVLTSVLYPYVYLMVRVALKDQSSAIYDVAQTLGAGPVKRFFSVGIPVMRPAIAAGMAIVMMETANDFGTVDYFAVQTLTTGIFTVWFEASNLKGAAQLAMLTLVLVLALVAMEKYSRSRMRFHRTSRQKNDIVSRRLRGRQALAASVICTVPFAVGFVFPVSIMALHVIRDGVATLDPALLQAAINTSWSAGCAAILTVCLAFLLVYGVRAGGNRLPVIVLPLTTLGYAAPGAVLGVGILVPLAFVDNTVADWILAVFGVDPGLMLTGTATAVILAYSVRFFAVAQGAVDAGMSRTSPNLAPAARTLGADRGEVVRRVQIPLLRRALLTGFLLVFIDAAKELPATLILRPFGFNTLATRVYEQASLENIEQAAAPAMMVIGLGLVAVLIITRLAK
jgi:iron(III) transport system permease protein